MKTMKGTFIIDTTVFVDYPEVFESLKGRIIIPTAVIKELDGHKNNENTFIAFNARKVKRYLDKLRCYNGFGPYKSLSEGVDIYSGDKVVRTIMIYPLYDVIDCFASPEDNKIVGAALRWQREHPKEKIVILTNDDFMRSGAEGMKIKTRPFPSYGDKVPEPEMMPIAPPTGPVELKLVKNNTSGVVIKERVYLNKDHVHKNEPKRRFLIDVFRLLKGKLWGRKPYNTIKGKDTPAVNVDPDMFTMDYDLYRLCHDFREGN